MCFCIYGFSLKKIENFVNLGFFSKKISIFKSAPILLKFDTRILHAI